MYEPIPKVPPEEVRKVQEQFSSWRAHKQGRQIPERLWGAAAKLCPKHGVHRICRWLHLNHTALQKRAGRYPQHSRSQPKQSFVEWPLPAGLVSGPSPAEYVLEVKGRVPRIHVCGTSAAEVATLVSALGGRGPLGRGGHRA
ncbi:MAG: hypothetical protein PHW33_03850 [Candidatus Portnoybacteria bacterium]|nr:hypothetical protein [Candidatus Portnoybacteria bacterium]